jgi:hypothetical protein
MLDSIAEFAHMSDKNDHIADWHLIYTLYQP